MVVLPQRAWRRRREIEAQLVEKHHSALGSLWCWGLVEEKTDLVQSLLDHGLTLVVQGGGGHVQEQDPGVPDQGSGDGDPLLLPSTHLPSTLPDQRAEPLHGTRCHMY